MAQSKPQFANFREAFCAYYRVAPEQYGRAALWRSLPFSRRLLAWPILAFNPHFFATDLDIIRSLGALTSEEQFSLQLDELHTVNRLERNIRRGVLGIRASGTRLMQLWRTVAPYVDPTLPPGPTPDRERDEGGTTPGAASPGPYVRHSPAIVRRVGRNPTAEASDPMGSPGAWGAQTPGGVGDAAASSSVLLRRLKRACDDICLGQPPAEAVARAGLDDVGQLRRLLEVNGASNPAFRWMLGQLQQGDRVAALESELAQVKRLLAEQAVELDRWRTSGPLG